MIRRGVLLSVPPFGAMAVFAAYGWLVTPDGAEIPVHWGFDGRADRYAGKAEAFLVMPLIAVAVIGIFALAVAIDPRRKSIERSATPLLVGWVGVLGLLTLIQAALALSAAGLISTGLNGWSVGRLVALGLAVLLVAIGNVLPKARSNWTVGVRWPWALESERSWEKSQRLGGRLLVGVGLFGAAAALVAPWNVAMAIILAGVILMAVLSGVMSYVWWRNDPERRQRRSG
jgi:uncharacterized membrane protein